MSSARSLPDSMAKKYTVTHYRQKCIGCGACVLEAPEQWRFDADGLSTLEGAEDKGQFWVGKISEEKFEENKRAEQNCPVHIIKVID